MGDRGNIIVKDGYSTVYLYTHWTGSDLPTMLKAALKIAGAAPDYDSRLKDGPYLARIIFCEMTKGRPAGERSGYGISSTMGDGGTDLTVNVDDQTITWHDQSITFKAYVDGAEFKV